MTRSVQEQEKKAEREGVKKGSHKRRRLDEDIQTAWGEETPVTGENRDNFLYGTPDSQ